MSSDPQRNCGERRHKAMLFHHQCRTVLHGVRLVDANTTTSLSVTQTIINTFVKHIGKRRSVTGIVEETGFKANAGPFTTRESFSKLRELNASEHTKNGSTATML